MLLSKNSLYNINTGTALVPSEAMLALPEKVLQFGTGVLLRALPDYFIDNANRTGIFNGRIVVVKSTDTGDVNEFDNQDSLYTLCMHGIVDVQPVQENVICSSISRVLSATKNCLNGTRPVIIKI